MNLIKRAINILWQPKAEWQVIKTENTKIYKLYASYIVPLAVITPLTTAIGLSFIGITLQEVSKTYRFPLRVTIVNALVSYVLSLWSVFVLSLVINTLAPTFSGKKNSLQAFKTATYIYTPSWLAGIFTVIPNLSFLTFLAGLHNLYLLYLGLPILMKSSRKKTLSYTVIVFISMMLLALVMTATGKLLLQLP